MQLIEVENQINMQYLTQLLQNEDFEIKNYQYRNNLWNADNLQSQELLSLFRQFKFYDSAKKLAIVQNNSIHEKSVGRHSRSKSSFVFSSSNQKSFYDNSKDDNHSLNKNQYNGEVSYDKFQIEEVSEDNVQIYRNNSSNNFQHESILKGQAGLIDQNSQLVAQRRFQEDPYTVKVIISDTDEINFPATMQKYPFKYKVYDLSIYQEIVTKGIVRRLIFLSISGYIGFDNTERVNLVKIAFLLEFDAFFEYLVKPNICSIIQFDQTQDEVLEILVFMWQNNIRKSMKYYDFMVKIATINPYFYKKDGTISPKILNLDLTLMESQFLPLVHRIMQTDPSITSNQTRLVMKQIIEYYEIHNSKRIVYPFIKQLSEKDVSDQIEEKFQNLIKEFDCPICFLPFQNCYTTVCGHSFCQPCIADAVQKFGNCPVCQQNVTESQLFRNFHLNEIKDIAYKEKEDSKVYEINRMKHMNTFKEKFQDIMQTNIINSVQAQNDVSYSNTIYLLLIIFYLLNQKNQSINNDSIQSYESIYKLKKQIQYLVNITFDQLMNQFHIES